jgi:hypothetical protein
MEKLREDIKKGRDMKDTSLTAYLRNISKLAKGITKKEFKTLAFLKEYKKVIDFIDDKSLSSQRVSLASILVALSPSGRGKYKKGYEEVAKKYTRYLTTQAKTYDDNIKTQRKSAKQKGNWATRAELEKVRKKYLSNIKRIGYTQKDKDFKAGKEKRHRELLQKYVVASLYLLHPPRRNSYANMKIISNKDYEKLSKGEMENNNYLVIVSRNKKFFSFGNYKTSKKYGVVEKQVERKLNTVLNLWLKFNDSEYLLLNSRGGKMTTNGLTKFLQKTFAPTGKKISSTMLRHIFVSEEFDPEVYKKMQEVAKDMGHSVAEQQEVYVKKDD